jgi:hypothetical protein
LLFRKDVFIFKAENKTMKTAFTYPLSISAPDKWFVRLFDCIIEALYNTDIQAITPPAKARALVVGRPNGVVCLLLPCTHPHPSISKTVCAVLHNKIYLLVGEE